MIALEGGSFGLQLGGQATDFVLLVMNRRGAQGILSSKVKLGGDASAAAGPKGRDASAAADVTMRAEILSYSRSRGLFAGVSLEGSTLRPDNDANKKLYHKELHASDIVLHHAVGAPAFAKQLLSVLNRKSGLVLTRFLPLIFRFARRSALLRKSWANFLLVAYSTLPFVVWKHWSTKSRVPFPMQSRRGLMRQHTLSVST